MRNYTTSYRNLPMPKLNIDTRIPRNSHNIKVEIGSLGHVSSYNVYTLGLASVVLLVCYCALPIMIDPECKQIAEWVCVLANKCVRTMNTLRLFATAEMFHRCQLTRNDHQVWMKTACNMNAIKQISYQPSVNKYSHTKEAPPTQSH